jgi:MFS family permease
MALHLPASVSVLRHRDFALLFTGQAASQLGDRLVMVAMPFAVLTLPGAGAADVGLVLGSSAAALAVFVLVGGVIADRLPRQLTMLASDVVRGVAQAASALLLATGDATVLRLAALQAVYGAAEAFFRPAALGLVPQLVSPGEEQPANALLSLSDNVNKVLGPALAGVLVAVVGTSVTLAVDAGTFAVSAVSLAVLAPREGERAPGAGFGAQLLGGWREVRSRPWVWTTLLSFCGYCGLVLPALFVLGPRFAEQERAGASSWGWISAGFGAGAVVGSVLALRWRPARPGVLIGGTLALASTQAAVCVLPLPTAAVALLEGLTGVCVSLCFTVWETALQQRIPEHARSRVSSFDYLASLALMPLGLVVVGPVADRLGTREVAVAATVLSGALCLAVAASPGLRGLDRLPDPAAADRSLMPSPVDPAPP